MIWNSTYECMSRSEMRQCQNQRLQEMLQRIYYNVPFYRQKLQEQKINIEDIRSIEDLRQLPFTNKDDLRDHYPFGLFACPMSEIIRVHASSGTTGKPTVVGYTRKDIATWSEVVARTLGCAEIGSQDIIQIAYGYGLFTGGLGLHYGSEKIGALVIPVSGGNTKRQLQLMCDFGSTALACTPSYALYLAEAIREEKIDPNKLKLKTGIFGAEPWSENMRKEIENKLHVKAIDIFGLSEVIGPGVSCECTFQNGLHINEDHFIPEIIDPKTLQPLGEGELGELVFTTVTKEGLPLLRYRTKDLTRLHYEKCQCGRTLVRMEKCLGRSDDMLIIRGVNVFPSQIESVLLELGETSGHYLIVVDRINNLDIMEVWIEVEEHIFSDEIRKLEHISRTLTQNIESSLGIGVTVKLVEPKTIERSEGKAKRVIDKRKI